VAWLITAIGAKRGKPIRYFIMLSENTIGTR
jgi:hypothetical protein